MSWASAYARQAKSDLQARNWLLESGILPNCHQLHYLQMAAEKLCKAHLSAQGQGQDVLEQHHRFIAKRLPVIAKQILSQQGGTRQLEGWVLNAIKKLARQIELLHPQVDDGGRVPSNCVYPWRGPDGAAIAPSDHSFALTLLHEKAGAKLVKIMVIAIDELIAQG